jgi:hypothetical protein
MSAPCHKQISAASFDHLVGTREQRLRDGKAERLCGFQIDDKLELGWLLDGEIAGLRTMQNLVD